MTLRKLAPRRSRPGNYRKSIIAAAIQHCFDGWAVMAAAGLLACNPVAAQSVRNWTNKIPLPSGPTSQNFVAGSSTIRQPQVVAGAFDAYQVANNTATIRQTDAAGILRWGSFDIAPGYKVVIDQPSTTAVLLNKVDGGAFDNKTVIDGMLEGKGQVYIYNANGIIFGKNSQVNVNALTATSLKIDDSRFMAGILAPSQDPIMVAEVSTPGAITVEGDITSRAGINTATGGRIVLAGPQVTNNGALVAKDGQVILAAGSSVFLRSPSDATMRGLVVQVGNYSASDQALNDVLGTIDVGHGNATMVGLAVNQSGRISANTSVNLNGSIYLRATAGARPGDNIAPQVGGELTLGRGSSTVISPDLIDTATATDDPAFKQSLVDLKGEHIVLQDNASIVAHGGQVTIAARANPDPTNTHLFSPSRVDLGSGSVIDVSGSTGTELAMESNVMQVELRGTELADFPLLRNSALRGTKVNIDIRKGTAIANVSGWLNQLAHNVGERTATGGTVSIVSEGDIIQRGGSKVDVSGGWVRYRDGYITTTKLGYNGSYVDIGSASSGVAYDSSITPDVGPRNFEKGYVQGYNAGSVTFAAPAMALQGSLAGNVTIGERQRDSGQTSASLQSNGNPKYANGFLTDPNDSKIRISYMADRLRPLGAALTIGGGELIYDNGRWKSGTEDLLDASGRPVVVGNTDKMGYTGDISLNGAAFVSTLPPPGEAMNNSLTASPLNPHLNLDMASLSAAGFANFIALTSGNIVIDAPVTLASGAKLTLGASGKADSGGNIVGGNITMNAGVTSHGGKLVAVAGEAIEIADNSRFDLSGLWTNDSGTSKPLRDANNNLIGNVVMAGGGIDLTGRTLQVDDHVSVDVSGGAWLGADGKLNKGSGGSIKLAMRQDTPSDTLAFLTLGNDLILSGYGLSQGGSVSLSGRGVVIGAPAAHAGDLAFLDDRFFSTGGFSSYSLSSTDSLTVANNTVIRPRALSWMLSRGYQSVSSGAMGSVANPVKLDLTGPNGSRPAVSLALSASDRTIFGTGALLDLDPKATATLTAGRQITIDGTISAPAGTINIGLNAAAPGTTDNDYDPTRSIWFGSSAKLLSRGTTDLVFTNNQGISTGEVLGGGSIRVGKITSDGKFSSAIGYLVAEPGALFDVSGVTSNPLSFKVSNRNIVTLTAASAAGSIDMRAREGVLFAGTLLGHAGQGERGGSLSVTLDRENAPGGSAYPQQDRVLTLASAAPTSGIIPSGLLPNQAVTGREGQGWLLLDSFATGGFDNLLFKSQNILAFAQGAGTLNLKAGSSLVLDAPVIRSTDSGSVVLQSGFVQLGSSDWRYQTPPAASAGNSTLSVLASDAGGTSGTIDLLGNSVTQGFANVNLSALSDIRLSGAAPQRTDRTYVDLTSSPDTTKASDKLLSAYAPGSFSVGGNLNLTSAQTYATTLSDFTLNAAAVATLNSNGRSAAAPYAAGGNLTIAADVIAQNGVLRSPFGSIALNATTSITYGANSLTSVAGEGLVPFGFVKNGRDWVYDYGNGWSVNFVTLAGGGTNLLQAALPQKSITSQAPSVSLDRKATIDLSGGGDLYAYEFSPGPGGSKDILSKSATNGLTFAVLPGYSAQLAPRDAQYGQDNTLQAGDSIYLSGIAGLPAGRYTLLPAHYALLPGAFAVTAVSGIRDISASANRVNTDGSATVAGYRNASTTGAGDTRWSAFNVLTSTQVRARSEYTDYNADAFFSAQATKNGVTNYSRLSDGGHIAFDVGSALALNGIIKLTGATGGAAGSADIASSGNISVVLSADQANPGDVVLTQSQISAMGADSLLLGGLRYKNDDGTLHVVVKSNQVTVGSDAAHPISLTAPDLIFAAKDTVAINAGATLKGDGVPAGGSQDISIVTTAGSTTLASLGDAEGALLRLNGSGAGTVHRGALAASVLHGTLAVDSNASVGASGGVVMDATKSFGVASVLNLGTGSALSIGASAISLGDGIPNGVSGLSFDMTKLTALNKLTSLSLSSYSSPIGFYGSAANPFSIGNDGMTLTLAGQGVQGYGSGSATVHAKTLNFIGGSGFTPANSTLPSGPVGDLNISGGDVNITGGSFQVNGYGLVSVTATGDVKGTGTGNFAAGSALTMTARKFTAASGSNTTVTATGALTLGKSASTTASASASPYGGHLGFVGSSIDSSADIELHSGQVDFTSAGAINVSSGSIDVSGTPVLLANAVAYAPGGSVNLTSSNSNVTIGTNAVIDVSAVGAEAGQISVKATHGSTGRFDLFGTLKGNATAGVDGKAQSQGRFVLDVDKAANFGTLNTALNNTGFNESRNLRVRQDNVTIAQGELIQAHQVIIATDNGSITVAGTIDASGAKGGSIELYASEAHSGLNSGNVTIQSTASLNASATQAATSVAGSAGDGGRIVIGSGTANGTAPTTNSGDASIAIASGASINVSGNGAGQGGSVLFRAPRVNAGNDVAVTTTNSTTLANTVIGAADLAVDGYKVYSATSINTASVETVTANAITPSGTYYNDSNTFISNTNANAMHGRLGNTTNLRAGVEIRSATDLTVNVNETATNPQDRGWNLNAWRFDGQAGVLTLRAAGDLIVNGSISDGFVKPASGTSAANKLGMPDWSLDASGSSSWSYRLVGGADFAAANPLSVIASTTTKGNFNLAFARPTGTTNDQPVALIRTGNGRIDIAAGRDIVLGSTTSSSKLFGAEIYTAGQASSPANFALPTNTLNTAYAATTSPVRDKTPASFGYGGGGISLYAARDVIGAPTKQMVNNWLFRQGRIASDNSGTLVANTAWWSRYDYFNEGVATFGGGDISIVADRTVKDMSASVATNAWTTGVLDGNGNTLAAGTTLHEQGGGDLRIRAGGDIQGGVFYVQKGTGSLRADGSVTSGSMSLTSSSSWAGSQSLYPVLAMGDASFQVTAGKDLTLEGAINPTLTNQSVNNLGQSSFSTTVPAQYSAFSTYGSNSAIGLTAVSGNLAIMENQTLMRLAGTTSTTDMPASTITGYLRDNFLLMMPPTLKAAALNGDISLGNGFTLWPSARGTLDLLAAGSVLASKSLTNGWSQGLVMLDLAPDSLPTATNPRILNIGGSVTDFTLFSGKSDGLPAHMSGGLHTGDAQPVRIVAANGNIDFSLADSLATEPVWLSLPKSADITAGGDIRNFGFKIQNLGVNDVTSIVAGRDFIDSTVVTGDNNIKHYIGGPGRAEILAGRNIDLGNSKYGLVTRGNLDNPYLPDSGASLMLLAGSTKPDYVGFLRNTLGMTGSDASLSAYASTHRADINDQFFALLAKVSGATGEQSLDLKTFDAVIASLFPTASVKAGDINVFGSEVKTERGGAIDMFAPGGSIYAGLVNVPAYLKSKKASDLGIFTIKGGEIRSLVKQDFSVNQGRVFTLGGGDITLVSQYGNIDAGRGAKTSAATPPPLLTTDASGNVAIDISGSIAGAGIATLQTGADIPPANVYPIAPRGTFDAGDAGIRSTGSVSIVAQTVLNANNIAAAGSVSGAKTADTSGLGGAVATAVSTPVAKTDSFNNNAAADPNAATSLTVELLGYGDAPGAGPISDKGQQGVTQGGQNLPSVESDDQRKKKKLL
jgi:filamentous hemagglutinin family protein